MASNVVDQRGLTIVAAKFKGAFEPNNLELGAGDVGTTELEDGAVTNAKVASNAAVAATKIAVAAGDDGLSAGNLQEALQAIWTELDGKVDA